MRGQASRWKGVPPRLNACRSRSRKLGSEGSDLTIVLLGSLFAAAFANDGTALLLTPIVLVILQRLEFPPAAAFAFVMASSFVADAASLPFVISNLVTSSL